MATPAGLRRRAKSTKAMTVPLFKSESVTPATLPVLSEAQLMILVLRAQAGDKDAFGRIYDHFFEQVYRYTAFRLSRDVAEDTVADIFVKVWEKIHTYKIRRKIPFGAWLFRIARHSVIDSYRAHRSFEEVSEDIIDPDVFNRAESRIHQREVLLIVRKAVAELPRRYREVLLLSYVAELPHREVARVLRLTEGAVRILKFRALRKLNVLLPPEMRESA